MTRRPGTHTVPADWITSARGSPNGPTGRTTPCHIAKLFSLRTALALYEKHGYSPAIRSGDLLFVSGQVGSLSDGTPEHDYEAQVRLAYENLKATLAAGGCTFDDIIDVTVFHTVPLDQTAEADRAAVQERVSVNSCLCVRPSATGPPAAPCRARGNTYSRGQNGAASDPCRRFQVLGPTADDEIDGAGEE